MKGTEPFKFQNIMGNPFGEVEDLARYAVTTADIEANKTHLLRNCGCFESSCLTN